MKGEVSGILQLPHMALRCIILPTSVVVSSIRCVYIGRKRLKAISGLLPTHRLLRGLALVCAAVCDLSHDRLGCLVRAFHEVGTWLERREDVAKAFGEGVGGELKFVVWSCSEEHALQSIFRCLLRRLVCGRKEGGRTYPELSHLQRTPIPLTQLIRPRKDAHNEHWRVGEPTRFPEESGRWGLAAEAENHLFERLFGIEELEQVAEVNFAGEDVGVDEFAGSRKRVVFVEESGEGAGDGSEGVGMQHRG